MYRKPLNVDSCPKPEQLQAYAAKELVGRRNEETFLHLKRCTACLRALAEITRVPSPDEIVQGSGSGLRLWKWLRAKLSFRGR